MFNTQDLTLVGVNTTGDILRWTIFIVLALTAICLLIKKTKINKITIAPFMIVVTIIAAPFLLITTKENTKKETTPPKDDDIYSITVPKTNTTPNIPDVPEKQIVPEVTILPETSTSSTPSSSSNTQQATNAQNNQSTTTDNSSSNEGDQDQNQGQSQNQGGNQGQDQPNDPDQPDEPEEPTLYHLTINNNDYVATDKSGDYEANAEIFIVAINREDDDYFFEGWLNDNNEIVSTEANYTFNMPASGLTLTPSYQSAKWTAVLDENNFEDTEVKLVIGETYQITIANRDTYEPIIITSDDENIATVDSETGIITAASAGSVSVFVEGSLSQRSRTLQATIYNSRVTIEFDAGVGSAVDDSVIFEGTALGSLPETSAEHYSFLGWFNENNEEITTSTTFDANTTLYAHWQIDTQTVTFDTHDGTTVDDAVIDYGSTLGEHTTTREGYDFQGWFTEENGQGTEYTANTEITANIELHAYWTKKVYDVTFNTHGGTTVDAITREHGDALGEITSALARYHLVGWFTEENGEGTEYTADTQITSTVELHAYWEANQVTLSFDSVLGTEVDDITINEGASLTEIPETTRTDYIFGGWFTQTNGAGEELTTASVIEADTLYYAKWTYDTMPIVWQHEGICEFNGGSSITGDECQEYANQKFIDTGIALYTDENYQKDFEIHFEIEEYDYTAQNDAQATFVNAKDPTVNTGLIVRRATNNSECTNNECIEVNSNSGRQSATKASKDYPSHETVQNITIVRQDGHIKYSLDGIEFIELQPAQELNNITANYRFVLSTWFGGYPDKNKPIKDENNNTISYQPKKFLTGKLKNMYIKLEREAPYESSDDIVEFDPTNPALTGYQTKINSWKPQVTAFTKDTTTINNSVWGIAEETFWDGLKDNFEENHCLIPSYEDSAIDSWTSGTTDCSKPLAYDTEVNAGLNVYLYDEATSTRGNQVAYTKSTAGTISNMIPGQTYYWEKDGDSSVYGYVKATSSNVHRMIDAGSVRNVRDLGGLAVSYTDDSNVTKTGTLKYEKLIRGERLWKNKNGVNEIQNLGINKEYALIEESNSPNHPANDEKLEDYVPRDLIHYDFDYGTNGYSIARQTVTEVMQDIINGNNVYFHCRIGSDRTGTLAYLLEGLLGVQDEDRYEEYELSYLSGHVDRARYYKQKSTDNAKKFVYMMGYVLRTRDIYDWYMAGTTDEDADKALIQDFRDAMINYN